LAEGDFRGRDKEIVKAYSDMTIHWKGRGALSDDIISFSIHFLRENAFSFKFFKKICSP
jgi:hypothetical protein